ncbi:hypothetical protein KVA01_18130 [Kocuria varians]|uniref:Uncharacterized protein n=1 Tax=Kocuria varians TaxID=1272 RepID=A0A4Y4D384_KOCVA|nr:hypothetical protein KVA01_18130 [Kocuria varians]
MKRFFAPLWVFIFGMVAVSFSFDRCDTGGPRHEAAAMLMPGDHTPDAVNP